MGNGPTYRLVVVREDGSREIVATGISEDNAASIRQILSTEPRVPHLVLELESDHSEKV